MTDTIDLIEIQHKFEEGINYNNEEFGMTFILKPRLSKMEIK